MAFVTLTKLTMLRSRVWQYINQLVDNVQWLKDNGGGTGSGDMTKTVYDPNDDGIVNKAAAVDDGITGNFVTAAEIASSVNASHGHANKTALDNVSGVNTGDQDLSDLMDKNTYDSNDDGIVDYAAALDDGITGNLVTAGEVADAVEKLPWKKYKHGFVNRIDSTFVWTDSTPDRTMTITGTFDIYILGIKYPISGSPSVQIANTIGLWYIYFNASGVLTANQNFPDLENNIIACAVWWNGTHGVVMDERHSYLRNIQWHLWAHSTIGCRYGSGLALTHSGTGASATFHTDGGDIWDEDIHFDIDDSNDFLPTANVARLWYQISAGAYTFITTPSALPFIWNSGTSRVQYVSSTDYGLHDLDNAKYINIWVYGVNDINVPIWMITETLSSVSGGYTTQAQARAIAPPSLVNMGLAPEMRLLYRLVVRGNGAIDTIITADDYRSSTPMPAGGTTSISASSVKFNPVGTISANNVQAAIEEVAAEAGSGSGDMTKSEYDSNNDGIVDFAAALDSGITGEYITASEVIDLLSRINNLKEGSIIQWPTATPPPGFILCDAGSYPKEGTYQYLYAIIGTTFGDDGDNFLVPDMSELFGINLYYIIKYTESISSVSEAHITNLNNPHSVTAEQIGVSILPVGTIKIWAGDVDDIEAGWWLCDGDSISRTGIGADLFAKIGTKYGSEDSNSYNLPDTTGMLPDDLMYVIKYAADSIVSPTHAAREDNPHNVTIDQLTDSAVVQATYKTGWIANSDWTNAEFLITHNLNANLSDLVVKFFISTDGTDANSFEITNTAYDGGDASVRQQGITIYQTNVNAIKIQTAVSYIPYVADDGTILALDSDAYYYKVAVYKMGTAVISTPTLGIYDSGWVANSDWTANNFTINHNLDAPLSDIIVKFLISTDGTDANAMEYPIANFDLVSGANYVFGVTISQINSDSLRVQTGTHGIYVVDKGTGAGANIDTEAYYYKVKVYKLGNISIVPSTAFEVLNISANYSISGSVGDSKVKEIWVTTGASNISVYLPYRSIRYGSDITIRKVDSGAGKVIVYPLGSETINGTTSVEITEQNGWWKFCPGNASSSEWKTETDGWSTIYQVEVSSVDSGINLDNTWDDVAGCSLALTGIRGEFSLSFRCWMYIGDSGLPTVIYGVCGIGKTSGNNAPDIYGDRVVGITTIANTMSVVRCSFGKEDIKYVVSADQTIYMKAIAYSDELNLTSVQAGGSTVEPAMIRLRRIR